jgi:hypothetical protein
VALPVHLDRKLRAVAVEVEDVGADRMLPAEVQAVELAASDRAPKQALGEGELAPKLLAKSRVSSGASIRPR